MDGGMEEMPNSSIIVNSEGTNMKISRMVLSSSNGVDTEQKLEEHSFNFDRAFGPSSSQDAVFQEVSEFVQSALDGYNVCLFSYGQTGSGKV